MILNLKIVRVNSDYCDYLRKFDNRVSYNKYEKELRPFIGILFKIDTCEYFAPLSSPKAKHKNMKNTIDFFKIKNGELGAVNFNNMIPVNKNNYSLVDLNKETLTIAELKYQKLLREQLDWLNANYRQVKNKSFKLYQLYNSGKLTENIKARCCNFKLLEEKCLEYKKCMNTIMKRKYADYPNWERVLKKEYKNRYFNNADFKGNISLLTAVKVKEKLVVGDDNLVIIDDGFKWLEIYPEDNKNIAISVCINNKNEFLEWYFDIAKDSALTEEGVPYIDDLYLDVILTPSGEIKMIDQEELQEALDKKIIMQEDFDLAYKVANNLINQLQGKVDKVIEFTKKYFDILNNSADEIIKLMKYKIREIEPRDNKEIEKVIRTCLIEFGANHEDTAWADHNLGGFSEIYNTDGNKYWIAEDENGKIVAGVGIGKLEGIDNVCELQKMYCLPEARGTGISHKLIDIALEYAKQYYNRCYIETLENMIAAQKFYEKYGFERIYKPLVKTEHFACDVRYIKKLK